MLAFELGPFGIRINAIAPGGIATGSPTSAPGTTGLTNGALTQPVAPEVPNAQGQAGRLGGLTPLGRRGGPEDIAQAALFFASIFFASNMAAFITGQTILVNGGAIAYL